MILLKDVWATLDVCAPGYTKTVGPHNWCIRWEGREYPGLPLGEHGPGKVRQMAKMLEILPCARKQLPGL